MTGEAGGVGPVGVQWGAVSSAAGERMEGGRGGAGPHVTCSLPHDSISSSSRGGGTKLTTSSYVRPGGGEGDRQSHPPITFDPQ